MEHNCSSIPTSGFSTKSSLTSRITDGFSRRFRDSKWFLRMDIVLITFPSNILVVWLEVAVRRRRVRLTAELARQLFYIGREQETPSRCYGGISFFHNGTQIGFPIAYRTIPVPSSRDLVYDRDDDTISLSLSNPIIGNPTSFGLQKICPIGCQQSVKQHHSPSLTLLPTYACLFLEARLFKSMSVRRGGMTWYLESQPYFESRITTMVRWRQPTVRRYISLRSAESIPESV